MPFLGVFDYAQHDINTEHLIIIYKMNNFGCVIQNKCVARREESPLKKNTKAWYKQNPSGGYFDFVYNFAQYDIIVERLTLYSGAIIP